MKLVGKYKLSELKLLNFHSADPTVKEGAANDICDLAGTKGVEVFATDYDGRTDGAYANTGTGWNCLVLADDVKNWRESAEALGDVCEDAGPPEADRHYGDVHWAGVDLISVPRAPGEVYWIDLEAS